jgi:hypothetical protein
MKRIFIFLLFATIYNSIYSYFPKLDEKIKDNKGATVCIAAGTTCCIAGSILPTCCQPVALSSANMCLHRGVDTLLNNGNPLPGNPIECTTTCMAGCFTCLPLPPSPAMNIEQPLVSTFVLPLISMLYRIISNQKSID